VVLADLEFRSTGCQLDQKNLTVSGNTISATAHHCVGMAAAICYVTDTFQLGRLTNGSYTFALALSRSSGAVPCAPSSTVNDRDSLTFSVQTALGIREIDQTLFKIFPNPASESISLSNAASLKVTRLVIRSIQGQLVLESDKVPNQLNLSALKPGLYTLELFHQSGRTVRKFIKH
jgi:hypothetical protein